MALLPPRVDLKTRLRDSSSDAELVDFIRFAVSHEELKHRVNEPGFVRASPSMSQIGRLKARNAAPSAFRVMVDPNDAVKIDCL